MKLSYYVQYLKEDGREIQEIPIEVQTLNDLYAQLNKWNEGSLKCKYWTTT